MVWPIAWLSGIVAFGVLVAVHLSRDTSGSTMSKLGDVLPAAIVSTVLVAGLAYATSGTRRWPWPLITLSVFGLAGVWYAVIAVLPQVLDDARAEDNGPADYSLTTPEVAGDWHRLRGPEVAQRKQDALSRLATGPAQLKRVVEHFVYAEYQRPSAGLSFSGFEVKGHVQDELRRSTGRALKNWMATIGAADPDWVDAGELGGSMGCSSSTRGLPVGVIYCAWADASTLGQVTIAELNLDIDTAASITREFREHVTSR